jgi:hypothetical protein
MGRLHQAAKAGDLDLAKKALERKDEGDDNDAQDGVHTKYKQLSSFPVPDMEGKK